MFNTCTLAETYTDIFNIRGLHYHQAMLDYPEARREEFEHAIRIADLEDGQVVCDVPSGGCYLSNFIYKSVKLFSVETSVEFVQRSQPHANNTSLLCEDISAIPLIAGTVDRVISLAGSHHLPSKPAFYREAHRLLSEKGIFCLADVRAGSGVADFLNIFVDRHNSMGHNGDFLTSATQQELEAAGFQVVGAAPICYHWHFESVDAMTRFCTLLFGLDQADPAQVLDGITTYLGYTESPQGCLMNWELYFFKAVKVKR
ncbi:MAG TPA: methyltransferase domain-containing protein [Chroococcidiopsis sp.]